MKKGGLKKERTKENITEKSCPHSYMKAGKTPGEKICISCGDSVYRLINSLSKENKTAFLTVFISLCFTLSLCGMNRDSLLKRATGIKHPTLLFTAGYRIPVNKATIINSGHGIYLEAGLNAGALLYKDLVIGLYGGMAMQDKLWYTTVNREFSNDYSNSIHKDAHFSSFDSSIIYSSADLFKTAKGTSSLAPGCATQSFHNYSLYYGISFRLPFKYCPLLKVYRGVTKTHYQGDGNIATKQKEFNIFELSRAMLGFELSVFNATLTSKKKVQNKIPATKNSISLSVYYESCNFYNSYLYFNDGTTTRRIPLQNFTTQSFLSRYKNEAYWGIKLFFCIT